MQFHSILCSCWLHHNACSVDSKRKNVSIDRTERAISFTFKSILYCIYIVYFHLHSLCPLSSWNYIHLYYAPCNRQFKNAHIQTLSIYRQWLKKKKNEIRSNSSNINDFLFSSLCVSFSFFYNVHSPFFSIFACCWFCCYLFSVSFYLSVSMQVICMWLWICY